MLQHENQCTLKRTDRDKIKNRGGAAASEAERGRAMQTDRDPESEMETAQNPFASRHQNIQRHKVVGFVTATASLLSQGETDRRRGNQSDTVNIK